jgi:hypothetical protein
MLVSTLKLVADKLNMPVGQGSGSHIQLKKNALRQLDPHLQSTIEAYLVVTDVY